MTIFPWSPHFKQHIVATAFTSASSSSPPFLWGLKEYYPGLPRVCCCFSPPSPYPDFKAGGPPSAIRASVEKVRRLCYNMIKELSLDVPYWGLRTFSDLKPGHAMFEHLHPLDGCSGVPHTECKRTRASKGGFRLSMVHLVRTLLQRWPAFSNLQLCPPPCRGRPSARPERKPASAQQRKEFFSPSQKNAAGHRTNNDQ